MSTSTVGYIRVSTSHQSAGGASLEAQRVQLEQYAAALGLDLVAIEVDAGLSASSLDRPGLQRALQRLSDGDASALLVTKLDRLTRSVADLGRLLERWFGAYDLLSVADSIDTRTAGGRLVLNVLTSVSQWEREAVSERTRTTMQHLRSEGCRVGAVPLGKRVAGRRADGRTVLADDRAEVETVARIRTLRASGATLRGICAALHAEGRKPKRGHTWHASAVRAVLQRAV